MRTSKETVVVEWTNEGEDKSVRLSLTLKSVMEFVGALIEDPHTTACSIGMFDRIGGEANG